MITNAYGAVLEVETWGQRAPWADYSGALTDREGTRRTVGQRSSIIRATGTSPPHWHVRRYGLFALTRSSRAGILLIRY